MNTTTNQTAIYSDFGGDLEMGKLVEMFVVEMPDRINAIVESLGRGDLESLQYATHQMKGAAGSYGFHQLTPYAAEAESSVREEQSEESVCRAVHELIDQCRRIRAGKDLRSVQV